MEELLGTLATVTAEATTGTLSSLKEATRMLADLALPKLRKVKASQVLEPTDDSEVTPASTAEMKVYNKNYWAVKHGRPRDNAMPTPDQIGRHAHQSLRA